MSLVLSSVDQPSRFALRRSAVASAKAEGRAVCSWFDKYILSEPLMVRQAHHERRVEGLTTSARSAKRNCPSGLAVPARVVEPVLAQHVALHAREDVGAPRRFAQADDFVPDVVRRA